MLPGLPLVVEDSSTEAKDFQVTHYSPSLSPTPQPTLPIPPHLIVPLPTGLW